MKEKKEIVGADIFLFFQGSVEALYKKLEALSLQDLRLSLIGNRGVRVWPQKMVETECIDTWRCRFIAKQKGAVVTSRQIADLLVLLAEAQLDFTQVETLCTFAGIPGYTLGQEEQ
jgi:isocitrate dehydrogenase